MRDAPEAGRESWLVLRAQSGDRESLEELLKSAQGPLFVEGLRPAGRCKI